MVVAAVVAGDDRAAGVAADPADAADQGVGRSAAGIRRKNGGRVGGGAGVLSAAALIASVIVRAGGDEACGGCEREDECGGGDGAMDCRAEHGSLPPGIGKHRPAKHQVSLVASILDQLAGGSSHLDSPYGKRPASPM